MYNFNLSLHQKHWVDYEGIDAVHLILVVDWQSIPKYLFAFCGIPLPIQPDEALAGVCPIALEKLYLVSLGTSIGSTNYYVEHQERERKGRLTMWAYILSQILWTSSSCPPSCFNWFGWLQKMLSPKITDHSLHYLLFIAWLFSNGLSELNYSLFENVRVDHLSQHRLHTKNDFFRWSMFSYEGGCCCGACCGCSGPLISVCSPSDQ